MLDSLFDGVSSLLNVFYELVPNYAFAIAMLTLVIMAITTPLTLKSTRSMLQMQRLQPEMRRIQQKHKDDRQKLNEELMAFYQEHGINPISGCLPMLLQAPVFIILFNVIRGLTHTPAGSGTFDPKYLDQDAALYQALHGSREMLSFGVDLAQSASAVLGEDFVRALPYLAMVVAVGVLSFITQRQIQGRSQVDVPGPQKMITRVFTVMFVVIAFGSPAALVVYFVVSSAWRVGQQWYITRSLYHGDDSPGAQAAKAMRELRAQKGGGALAGLGRGDRGGAGGGTSDSSRAPATPPRAAEAPGPTARTAGKAHPRSRKKKKRR
jgi:YidC/Oxa1 family membrane protein insertase